MHLTGFITKKIRRLISFVQSGYVRYYVRHERNYTYGSLHLKVFKHVFHPGMFRSTKVLAAWLETQPLHNKKAIEIGCGAGLIALIAAKKGAIVTAVDVNTTAVANTALNAAKNKLDVTVIHSDIFDAVPRQEYDVVLINPPYYPKNPSTDYEKAWYCGEHFEYFHKLFAQLKERTLQNNGYLILSDSCDLHSIHHISAEHNIKLLEIYHKKVAGELLTIYKTERII